MRLAALAPLGAVAALTLLVAAHPRNAIAQQPRPAPAPAQIGSEVLVILASNNGTGISPALASIPQLRQPPFNGYNSLTLLNQYNYTLALNKATTTTLPTGSSFFLTYTGVAPPQPNQPTKFSLNATVQTGSAPPLVSTTVNLQQAARVFIRVQKYQGGDLVLGLKVQ